MQQFNIGSLVIYALRLKTEGMVASIEAFNGAPQQANRIERLAARTLLSIQKIKFYRAKNRIGFPKLFAPYCRGN